MATLLRMRNTSQNPKSLQATLFGERRTLDGEKSEVLNYIQDI